jgi:hypothetical protein
MNNVLHLRGHVAGLDAMENFQMEGEKFQRATADPTCSALRLDRTSLFGHSFFRHSRGSEIESSADERWATPVSPECDGPFHLTGIFIVVACSCKAAPQRRRRLTPFASLILIDALATTSVPIRSSRRAESCRVRMNEDCLNVPVLKTGDR